MVVEDDFLIRMILVEELVEAGYHVKEAETADQAVDLLVSMEPPLRLLVTDIHMPGTRNGIDLASHVHDLMPDVPIIYTTGRPDALIALTGLGNNQFLVRKPYVPSEVLARVRTLLAA